MARALELAPADQDVLQRSIRANLAAWRSEISALKTIIPARRVVSFSPDGKTLLTGSEELRSPLQFRSAGDGSPVGQRMWPLLTTKISALNPQDQTTFAVFDAALSPDG